MIVFGNIKPDAQIIAINLNRDMFRMVGYSKRIISKTTGEPLGFWFSDYETACRKVYHESIFAFGFSGIVCEVNGIPTEKEIIQNLYKRHIYKIHTENDSLSSQAISLLTMSQMRKYDFFSLFNSRDMSIYFVNYLYNIAYDINNELVKQC